MAYKIDIHHRQKNITFGPRFKGESGKDIFAIKVALGLISPLPESGELESGAEVSYDRSIPMDQQKWFNCSTGVGMDVTRAAKFDSILESALITYQVNNKFLITVYYFEKYGFESMLNAAIDAEDKTFYEAEVIAQIQASLGLFESELGTIGEATIAILHGWLPATKLTENTSYTHDSRLYSQGDANVFDIVPSFLYESLRDPLYPQNFQKLVESGIAVGNSLFEPPPVNAGPPRSGETIEEYAARAAEARRRFDSTRFTLAMAGENTSPDFKYAFIRYYAVVSANSQLYVASAKVIDYYLENNLFSRDLSPDELAESVRRAMYPDAFSREDPFIIDNTRIGIYLQTEYTLSSTGPIPPTWPSNQESTIETIQNLEEQALIRALRHYAKPEIWNFLKNDIDFVSAYFAGVETNVNPVHSGLYPVNFTRQMIQQLNEKFTDLNVSFAINSREFKEDNYWVISTSDIRDQLDAVSHLSHAQHWRALEGISNTEPLIKFIEFITPSLRPGQNYRALFEINRKKFDAIINGDQLTETQAQPLTEETSDESVCLDENSEQAKRTYEEYKAHAIKRRRELVREIRERLQDNSTTTIDFGGFDSVFEGLRVENYNDQQLLQKLGQILPTQDLIEFLTADGSSVLTGAGATLDVSTVAALDQIASAADGSNDSDEERNILKISPKELKERIQTAIKDLREAGDVIRRERISFSQASNFDAHNEASKMKTLEEEIETVFTLSPFGINSPVDLSDDSLQVVFKFSDTENKGQAGHMVGKKLVSIQVGSNTALNGVHFTTNTYEALFRPRTLNYLSKIKDMTFFPKLSSFFDDSRNACKDLNIRIDKITTHAYIKKYTSGLVVVSSTSEGFTFQSWFDERVADPLREFAERSAENTRDSMDPSLFNREEALRALGADCRSEEIWKQIFDRLDPVSLLCDYVKCLDLPSFDIRFPSFSLDEFPGIPIVGWYTGLIKFLEEETEKIIDRLGCTIGRLIIDKLAFPFCQEQLNNFISSDLVSSDYARRAVIEALTRTGVPANKSNEAKSFFDAVSNILTGREMCYILAGNRPDDATMGAIRRLSQSTGVSGDLQTEADIINFFGVIGLYMPDDICEALSRSTTVFSSSCEETSDYIQAVRNRLQSQDGTLTDQEINAAIEMAERNKQEEADRLKNLFENGFSGLVPPVFDFGNPNAIMPDFSEFLKNQHEETAKNLFSTAKSQYMGGLAQYVPAMYASSPVDLWPYDERYDQVQVLRFESAIQQLQDFASLLSRDGIPAADSTAQLAFLHQLYQTELIETISSNLVPEYLRDDLTLIDGDKYLVPHDAVMNVRNPRTGDITSTVSENRVLVHKRMIDRGVPTREQIEQEIQSLNVIIARYTKRVSRTSGTKRDTLRALRRPFIRRKNKLAQALENENFQGRIEDNIVDYEYFMAFQKVNDTDFQQLLSDYDISFKLVPHTYGGGLYSTRVEYTNFNPDTFVTHVGADPDFTNIRPDENNKLRTGVLDIGSITEFFRRDLGIGDVDAAISTQRTLDEITQRVDSLKNRITEILQNRPTLVDEMLFPGLQKMLDDQAEKALEKFNRGTVSQDEDSYVLEFNAGAIYSPTIIMKEIPESYDKDRFDIIVKKDFFTGLSLSSDNEEENQRTYRYCNKLPDVFQNPEQQSGEFFSKRYRFRNAVFDTIKRLAISESDLLSSPLEEYARTELFKSTTESLFETLLDSLGESYLFDSDEVELLDKRLSGKRIIQSNCVSNRFSYGDASVISFDDTIVNDVSAEVAKEMAKPENAPENQDFESPTAFSWAVKNASFKGFIRTCLIDILLKGGIAYSRWDIEPIMGEQFFFDYVISQIKFELESDNNYVNSWPSSVERVTGISNRNAALESLVKEEILKLSNYSKQVFNPTDNITNFYNWFLEKHIEQFHICGRKSFEEGIPFLAKQRSPAGIPGSSMLRESLPAQKRFLLGKEEFIIEHYIELRGSGLVSLVKETLDIEEDLGSTVVLNIDEFIEFLDTPNIISDIKQELSSSSAANIYQGVRVVLINPIPSIASDQAFNAVSFTEDEEGEEVFSIEEIEGNRFTRAILEFDNISEENLRSRSRNNRSYFSKIRYLSDPDSADPESNTTTCFALPLASSYRLLDFEDCYNFETYRQANFTESIPFMMQELSESGDYQMIFDHIFPVRRLMSIVSVFATSVVSGYNNMPTIFSATKQTLSGLSAKTSLGRRARREAISMSQGDFLKQLTENFPTDESSCFDFPSGLEEYFKQFWEELMRLIRKMPSIILRGIANQLDPAYKEMRQHYINCDIKNLTYRGLRPAGTGLFKLTNGLYLSGRQPLNPRQDVSSLQGKNRGKYVPLATGIASDFGMAVGSLPSFGEFGLRLGLIVSKLISYIYSGNQPFLDPSFYFKIPCQDIDTGAWRDYGKYDAGIYGRYGHPLSPFTLLALATPQLESDKRLKENSCSPIPEKDCEPGEEYTSDTRAAALRRLTDESNALLNQLDPSQLIANRRLRVEHGSCIPWEPEEITESMRMISRFEENTQEIQDIKTEWSLLTEDRDVYDSRSGVIENENVLAGGGQDFDAGERLGPPNSYGDIMELYADMGSSGLTINGVTCAIHECYALIDPSYYDVFVNMWRRYRELVQENNSFIDSVRTLSHDKCETPETQEIRLFLSQFRY